MIFKSIITFVLLIVVSACDQEAIKPSQPSPPDTTQQEFTLETHVLGITGSLFADVAIVNDTLAYAVGEIYVMDSLGNIDHPPYGMAIWNGKNWRLKRLNGVFQGRIVSLIMRGVFSLSADMLWFSGGDVYFWNGKSEFVTVHPIARGGINENPVLGPGEYIDKIWGTSNSNLFAVGHGGAVAHYNGSQWRRIESGTKVHIKDVWGIIDKKTGEEVVLCAVSDYFEVSERKILRIFPTGRIDSVPWRADKTVESIWFETPEKLYAVGGGVFVSDSGKPWVEITGNELPRIYSARVRGQKNNDVFVAMNYGVTAHFNGKRWKTWTEPLGYIWYSCDYKHDIFMAVGSTADQKGLIVVQRRK